MPRNPTFCSFASFLIVLLAPLFDKSDSSGYLTISMTSFVSSFENIYVMIPN